MNNRLSQSLHFAARLSRRSQQWFPRLEHAARKLFGASRRKRYAQTSVADWPRLRVRVSRVFVVTIPLFVFAACNVERTSEPTGVVERANVVSGLRASEFSDRLARGFAVALRDSLVRSRLHDALRNSPFPYQAIAFQPYLAGRSGSSLLREIALGMEMSTSQLSDSLSTRPLLTLAMTALTDRIRWSGDLDVAIAVSAEQGLKGSEALTAYSPDLKSFRLTPTMEHRPHPTILIANAPIDFGGDPEAVRGRAPARRKSESWHGVASAGGGIGSAFVTCDDEPTQDYCDEPSSGPGGSAGPLWTASSLCSPYTFSAVTGSNDADTDGIKDECETELAQAFEPEILFEAQEIHHWREPHFIVENFGGLTQIGYLLSYYYDGGQFSHNGDSEMIIVRVRPSGNAWELVNITTTAHYGVTWIGMDETRTYGWQNYFFFAGSVKARIYASRSHHANYNTP